MSLEIGCKPPILDVLKSAAASNETAPPIIKAEVKEAVRSLKDNKSSGVDNIQGELLKYCGEEVIEILQDICYKILKTGIWPADWTKSILIPIPKKASFKRDENVGNFLVRSALKTNEQPGTFKCACSRCKTCLFIINTSKISGPKRSVKITDRLTCTPANVIYCITCTLCNKLYIGETGRRLGDRFREHLRDVEKNDKDASKPVACHFNLPNHSKEHMAICGLSLHLGTTESRKNLEQKFIFQIGTLNPHGINERFIQLIYSYFSRCDVTTTSVAPTLL